jgi:phage tail-like protein
MAVRDNPYGAFNFTVRLGTFGGEDQIVGGFSEVSGLANEVKYSEYRNGNDKENHVRKIANIETVDNVTLKRGVIGDLRLFSWLKSTREGAHNPQTVIITLLDEERTPVCRWTLTNAQAQRYIASTLAAKGGGEVAMEELHLVAERIDFESV